MSGDIGRVALLQRTIEIDPFELTVEEKIYRSLKRLCTIFAVGAVTLCVLDLTNIRSVDAAAEFLHDSSARIVELPNHVVALPDRIRSEIRNISLLPAVPPPSLTAQATASIPRDKPAPTVAAVAPPVNPAAPPADRSASIAKPAPASAVAALAAVRHEDAVEWAMAPSPLQPVSLVDQLAAPAKVEAQPASLADIKMQPALMAKAEAPPTVLAKLDLPPAAEAELEKPTLAPMGLPTEEPAAAPSASIAPTPVSLPMTAAIPLDMVPLPRAAPGLPPPSPAERLHLDDKAYAKAERCLANAVYFESRSEPVRGQMAVAQVVMNRVFSGFYPNDVCGVVYQNAGRYLGCQFTFACDGKRKLINERGAWARANRIAKQTLDGQIYVPEVAKSTHYHAVYVHPNWVREMHRLVRYGEHAFYRPIAWGNGADEPVWGSAAMVQKMAQNKKK